MWLRYLYTPCFGGWDQNLPEHDLAPRGLVFRQADDCFRAGAHSESFEYRFYVPGHFHCIARDTGKAGLLVNAPA